MKRLKKDGVKASTKEKEDKAMNGAMGKKKVEKERKNE